MVIAYTDKYKIQINPRVWDLAENNQYNNGQGRNDQSSGKTENENFTLKKLGSYFLKIQKNNQGKI